MALCFLLGIVTQVPTREVMTAATWDVRAVLVEDGSGETVNVPLSDDITDEDTSAWS